MDITYLDQQLLSLFDQSPNQKFATVHSIFDKVINFLTMDEQHLISLALEEVVLAPKMMKTSDTSRFSQLKESLNLGGALFLQENQTIKIGETLWCYKKADLWKGELPSNGTASLTKLTLLAHQVDAFVSRPQKDSGLLSAWLTFLDSTTELDQKNPYGSAFRQRIQDFSQALKEGASHEIRETAERFIGLGGGLTPSGDDFLLGCLAFWQRFNDPFFQMFQEEGWLENVKSKTTTVSYFMLKESLEGFVNDSLRQLLQSDAEKEESLNILEGFLKIGATSGIDMLIGVLFAVNFRICYTKGI